MEKTREEVWGGCWPDTVHSLFVKAEWRSIFSIVPTLSDVRTQNGHMIKVIEYSPGG